MTRDESKGEISELTIVVKTPALCSSAELDAFEKMVLLSGEVTPLGLRNRIDRAHHLAWANSAVGNVTAVAALKRPTAGYRHSVFAKSGAKEDPMNWVSELGWIFVDPGFRRRKLATRLVEGLLTAHEWGSIYATSRADNDPILPLLEYFGFAATGEAYKSTEGDYRCLLHLKMTKNSIEKRT